MTTISITCSDCDSDFNIELSKLDRESNGSSGNHTTSYTYTGEVECPHCGSLNEVTVNTDEVDDTGEVLSID